MKIKNINTNVNFSDVSFGKNDMIGQSLKKLNQIDSKVDIYDFKRLSINVIYDGSIETDYENFTLFFSPVGYTVPFENIYLNNYLFKILFINYFAVKYPGLVSPPSMRA